MCLCVYVCKHISCLLLIRAISVFVALWCSLPFIFQPFPCAGSVCLATLRNLGPPACAALSPLVLPSHPSSGLLLVILLNQLPRPYLRAAFTSQPFWPWLTLMRLEMLFLCLLHGALSKVMSRWNQVWRLCWLSRRNWTHSPGAFAW